MKRPRPLHKPDRAIALLTIHGAAEMGPEGRVELADWLEHCAETLRKDGHNYSRLFTARYLQRARRV